jgi:hypothetical protein
MRHGVNNSPAQSSPQEMSARRSTRRSLSHKLPPARASKANQQQADPASSAMKTRPSKGKVDGGEKRTENRRSPSRPANQQPNLC